MPISFKILGVYHNANSAAVIYTVGAAPVTSAIVTNVRAYNMAGAAATMTLGYRATAGGSFVTVAKVPVGANASAVFNTELTLASGNVLEVNCTASLDVTAFGAERSS